MYCQGHLKSENCTVKAKKVLAEPFRRGRGLTGATKCTDRTYPLEIWFFCAAKKYLFYHGTPPPIGEFCPFLVDSRRIFGERM